MSESPTKAAKSITPSWSYRLSDYDGLEIHPVRDYDKSGDQTWCEVCEPHEAEFWSVYGHLIEGGVECLEDFETEGQADLFASRLLATHPHLNKHGIS